MPCCWRRMQRKKEESMLQSDMWNHMKDLRPWNCCKACFYCVAFNPVGATLVAIGAYKAYTLLAAGIATVAAKLGCISRILAVAFAVIGGAALLGCGWDIVDALIQGKGVDFSVKKTSWGMPYGIDVSVC